MSNEIYHSYPEGSDLYALVWRKTDDKVYDRNAGSDTFEVYVDANIANYNIDMANHGAGSDSPYYTADFPSGISAGIYRVQVMVQAAGAPHEDNDAIIAHGELYWDGTDEIDISTLNTDIAALSTDQSIVHNIYDETVPTAGLEISEEPP